RPALGAEGADVGGRLPRVLCRDGLLGPAPDVLPPERLLPRRGGRHATGGQGRGLLRVRLRRGADHGVPPPPLSRLALHARRPALAHARLRPLALPPLRERGSERAGAGRRSAAHPGLRRDRVPRGPRARDQSPRGGPPPRGPPQAGRRALRELRRRAGRRREPPRERRPARGDHRAPEPRAARRRPASCERARRRPRPLCQARRITRPPSPPTTSAIASGRTTRATTGTRSASPAGATSSRCVWPTPPTRPSVWLGSSARWIVPSAVCAS